MRITPLYADSNSKFSEVTIFGTPYLANPKNIYEREHFTSKLEGNGNHLYKQWKDFLFLYENKLFRIEDAKACELHFSESTKNYLFFLVYGNDDYIYFYSVTVLNTAMPDKKQVKKEVIITKFGKLKAANFKYFVYFYKKSITIHDASGKPRLTMYDEEFAKDSNPFFVLKAISKCLEEKYEDFRLVPFSDSKEAFSQNNDSETLVTTFIKLTREKMYSYDIVGNDFMILKNFVWEEYDIIDDWEYYQDPAWTNYYKDWILNGTKIINISDFLAYDVKRFMEKFKNPNITLWKPNEEEIYVFFYEKAEESAEFKKGILWNLKNNTIYPNNIIWDENAKCEPSLFWHWNHEMIPNITVEQNQNKNIFKIWYRKGKGREFENIESHETPIVFYDNMGNQIYFVKNSDDDYMLVTDEAFNLKDFNRGVSFFEEICLCNKYPLNLQRKIDDEGKYFSNIYGRYFTSNSIIIVKKKLRNDAVFLVYFGFAFHNLDIRYSFKSYTFLTDSEEFYKTLKIQIEGNPRFTEPHYIILAPSHMGFRP